VERDQEAGAYEITLDATALAPGVYVARLQAGDFVVARRLTLTR
jgi:hypothetical protein